MGTRQKRLILESHGSGMASLTKAHLMGDLEEKNEQGISQVETSHMFGSSEVEKRVACYRS